MLGHMCIEHHEALDKNESQPFMKLICSKRIVFKDGNEDADSVL